MKEISRAEPSDENILALLKALDAFKSTPTNYAIKHEPARLKQLWSELEKRDSVPDLQETLNKFKSIFGEVILLYRRFQNIYYECSMDQGHPSLH